MNKVLIIYTGGTIGMKVDPVLQVLVPFDFSQILQEVPELGKFDIQVNAITFDDLIDSSDIEPAHWVKIAQSIESNYERYDGFVVLHGTDTMAFSASALSFMLENLSKPVIFTGSQLPIGAPRTDGKENLVSAVEIAAAKDDAGRPIVPEVCIFFGEQLMRGNRTTKTDAENFRAFQSPNCPPLATSGINIRYNLAAIRRPEDWGAKLRVNYDLDTRVSILKIHPGITEQVVKNILLGEETRAVIVETYGAGNAPSRPWFLDLVKQSVAKGKVLVNITQCPSGRVNMNIYATGKNLLDAGVLSGADMTTEAMLSKLFCLLGMNLSYSETARLVEENLRGEI